MSKAHRFYTYGTLRRGECRHSILLGSKFIGEAVTAPKHTLVSLGAFPALLLEGETVVKGEVYEVSDDVLKTIDMVEGYPRYYDRTEIETSLGKAWAYYQHGNSNGLHVIETGDWRQRDPYQRAAA